MMQPEQNTFNQVAEDVSDLTTANIPTEETTVTMQEGSEDVEEMSSLPISSLKHYFDLQKKQTQEQEVQYSENEAAFKAGEVLSSASNVKSSFANLASKTPEERASIGAKLGGGVGLSVGGPVGAVVGTGVGAFVGRATGLVQSGEHDKTKRNDELVNTFKSLGIVTQNNRAAFDDGRRLLVTADPNYRLSNISAIMGAVDRSVFEVDKTNPFTNRSRELAAPLAYYITNGLMGKTNKDKLDNYSRQSAEASLVNMFQDGADDVSIIVNRAKQVASKLGLSNESLRTFFDAHKHKISKQDAEIIRKGIEALYAG